MAGIRGYRKVKGLDKIMKQSYYGYPRINPTYFEWLHHLFLVIGNGYHVDEQGKFSSLRESKVVQAAKDQPDVPEEWFTAPIRTTSLYPYCKKYCLIDKLYTYEVPMTKEIWIHLKAFLKYLVNNKFEPMDTISDFTVDEIRDIVWLLCARENYENPEK
jgi:hypothetical protein